MNKLKLQMLQAMFYPTRERISRKEFVFGLTKLLFVIVMLCILLIMTRNIFILFFLLLLISLNIYLGVQLERRRFQDLSLNGRWAYYLLAFDIASFVIGIIGVQQEISGLLIITKTMTIISWLMMLTLIFRHGSLSTVFREQFAAAILPKMSGF